jgi:hypothetical protein
MDSSENKLIKAIDTCYKKLVKHKECTNICKMMDNLLGVYSACESAKNIKPYVIIGSNMKYERNNNNVDISE